MSSSKIRAHGIPLRMVQCRVCQKFCPGTLDPRPSDFHGAAEKLGWTKLEREFGHCPECKFR